MAQQDDGGDRTEQPTARRREEAREEGQVARSQDLTAAASLLAALVLLRFFGPGLLDSFLDMLTALGEPPELTADALAPWIRRVSMGVAAACLPLLALLVVCTAGAGMAQAGLMLTPKKLGFKPEHINPVKGLQRVFSSEALVRFGMGLFKVLIVGALAYFFISSQIVALLATGGLHPAGFLGRGAGVVFDLALRLGFALLVLALLDYAFQRWRLEQQLMMTKQQVRDELKKMEGDPLLKQRRRQMQARLAMQRVQAEVPRADVVVTNPTHYAIAIRYDERTMRAPRVVAKGKDLLAQRIRLLAQQHQVPIVERPPLARALYAGVEVGQDVPPAFYRAVAEVLAYVYRLAGRAAG
ncbi:MAG: flagellar biosynthesis protein FlhB [Phycisphaerales bacterium]|nr:flagellar biosynthesis protein FlhB [Phycisphaerales bacterium]